MLCLAIILCLAMLCLAMLCLTMLGYAPHARHANLFNIQSAMATSVRYFSFTSTPTRVLFTCWQMPAPSVKLSLFYPRCQPKMGRGDSVTWPQLEYLLISGITSMRTVPVPLLLCFTFPTLGRFKYHFTHLGRLEKARYVMRVSNRQVYTPSGSAALALTMSPSVPLLFLLFVEGKSASI